MHDAHQIVTRRASTARVTASLIVSPQAPSDARGAQASMQTRYHLAFSENRKDLAASTAGELPLDPTIYLKDVLRAEEPRRSPPPTLRPTVDISLLNDCGNRTHGQDLQQPFPRTACTKVGPPRNCIDELEKFGGALPQAAGRGRGAAEYWHHAP